MVKIPFSLKKNKTKHPPTPHLPFPHSPNRYSRGEGQIRGGKQEKMCEKKKKKKKKESVHGKEARWK